MWETVHRAEPNEKYISPPHHQVNTLENRIICVYLVTLKFQYRQAHGSLTSLVSKSQWHWGQILLAKVRTMSATPWNERTFSPPVWWWPLAVPKFGKAIDWTCAQIWKVQMDAACPACRGRCGKWTAEDSRWREFIRVFCWVGEEAYDCFAGSLCVENSWEAVLVSGSCRVWVGPFRRGPSWRCGVNLQAPDRMIFFTRPFINTIDAQPNLWNCCGFMSHLPIILCVVPSCDAPAVVDETRRCRYQQRKLVNFPE